MANTRSLKSGEKELLSQVFVKTIPLDHIKITDAIGLQNRPYTLPVLLSKDYHVNVGTSFFGQDMSTTSSGQALLVHECSHVWQGVTGIFEWDYVINSVACQAISIFQSGTAYDYEVGKDWSKYGAEQQAGIIEDWFKGGSLITSNRWRYIRDNVREPGFGGQAYFFKDAQYTRWTIGTGADSGYPKAIDDNWNSWVREANASFSRLVGEDEFYYFFKGDQYLKWKHGSGPISGYPKAIDGNWDSDFIKDGLDAAICCDNNKVYFFKGDEYIRYTFGSGQDSGYPKKISSTFNVSFINDGFDTCIYWGNGKAYFFKGDEYIRYTMGDGVDSGYPKKIADTWNTWMRSGLKKTLLKRKDVF